MLFSEVAHVIFLQEEKVFFLSPWPCEEGNYIKSILSMIERLRVEKSSLTECLYQILASASK